jgi:hypothetical protein
MESKLKESKAPRTTLRGTKSSRSQHNLKHSGTAQPNLHAFLLEEEPERSKRDRNVDKETKAVLGMTTHDRSENLACNTAFFQWDAVWVATMGQGDAATITGESCGTQKVAFL